MNDGENDTEQESHKKSTRRSREMRNLLREYDARNKKRHGKPAREKVQMENDAGIGSRVAGLLKASTESVSNLFSSLLDLAGTIWSYLVRSKIFYGSLMVLLLVMLAPRLSGMFTSQANAYEVLHRIWDEAKEKQLAKPTADSWSEYQSRSQEQITKLIPILKQKAHINDPASMSLLWIARDYLPAVLQGPPKIDGDLSRKIDRHFSDVKLSARRNARTPQSSDWWMLIVVGLDAVLVLSGIWYFVGQRRLHRN